MSPTTPTPDSAEWYYARGEKNFENEEFDTAIADFTNAIRLKPDFAEAYFHRGMLLSEKGQKDQAVRDYTEAIRIKPDYEYAYYQRGNEYSDKNNYDSAIRDYTEAIRLKSDFGMAHCQRGWAHLKRGRYREAAQDCEEAFRLEPNRAVAHFLTDSLRQRIAIESASRSAESRVAKMTIREAEHLVFNIVSVALDDKSHRYAPVSALKGYDLHQICVAQKLVIANQFLGLAHRDDFQEEFEQYLGGASAWLMSIQMHFVPDDQVDIVGASRAFDFDDPQFRSAETPHSFGKFCIAVGADHPLFWQKIYTRLGLEYNEKSPKGNDPVLSDSNRPEHDRDVPTTGCAILLAAFVLQGLVLVVWLFSGFACLQVSIPEVFPPNPSFVFLPDALAQLM